MNNVTQMAGRVFALAACFFMTAAGSGLAAAPQTHTWELGAEVSWIEYEEAIMSEEGMMYGPAGSYTYRGRFTESLERGMLRLETRLGWGEVDYDGSLSDGTPYTIDDIDDFIWEIRGLGGYDFTVFTDAVITPYFGFGYRYLNDDLGKDPAGYERESNYYYSPVGFEILKPLDNGWSVGAVAEYDIFWSGTQKSHLSDAVSILSDVENDQEGGYGVRGSLRLIKKTENIDWLIEPFVRYWSIDESEATSLSLSGTIIGTAVEPENESTEYGLKVAVLF